MNRGHTIIIIIGGIVILSIGFLIPATQTRSATTCVEDPVYGGENCVETVYQTPNFARGPLIGLGFVLIISGVIFYSQYTESESTNAQFGDSREKNPSEGSLAHKLKERETNQDDKE